MEMHGSLDIDVEITENKNDTIKSLKSYAMVTKAFDLVNNANKV